MNTEEAARAVGVSLRQVNWWVQSGVVVPSAHAQTRFGDARRWSRSDLARLRTVAEVMALGANGEHHSNIGAAKLVMKHWRKGPGWLVLSPVDGRGALATKVEKVPKAIRQVGCRAMVVPLP